MVTPNNLPSTSFERRLSDAAYGLILDFEVGGGETYYNQFLSRPTWPGASSGVTIGIGYDLGYNWTMNDWTNAGMDAAMVAKLEPYLTKTGDQCWRYAEKVKDVRIPWEMAWQVFNDVTVPKFIKQTLKAFPGADKKLSPDGFGALVSLVFNRGPEMGTVGQPSWERRKHMRAIKAAIKTITAGPALNAVIADQIRQMISIWKGTSIEKGMRRRRNAEAALVESST